jgi:hypothetical protein
MDNPSVARIVLSAINAVVFKVVGYSGGICTDITLV